MAAHPGEKITEGLDGLRERLKEYFQMGARFAKWRAVIAIGEGIPSRSCIEANAQALARYAAFARKPDWFPLSNRKFSWTANILWSGAVRRRRKSCEPFSTNSIPSACCWKA